MQGINVNDPDDRSYEAMLSWITKAKINLAKEKVHATIEFAKNMVAQGDKVIIFSDYIDPVVEIAKAFGDEAICYLAELNAEERSEAQRQFQEDPSKKVFVATSKIASVALTLTEASKVIFNDMPYSPGTLLQAEDRAHRNGQRNSVNIYRMVARGTLDDQVTAILTRKAEILKTVLEGRGKDLTNEEKDEAQKSILTDIIDYFRVSYADKKELKAK